MGSYLVIGIGRFGSSLATELYQMKHDVLAVDKHEENITKIVNHVTNVIIGDAKDEAVLRSLDIQSFDCVIVAMATTIEDSVLTSIMAKEMGAKMLVCKAQNEWHEKILVQIGADKVIRPERDTGKRVAHLLVQKDSIDQLELSPDYCILELRVPNHWINKSLVEINLRKKYGVTLIAIRSAKTEELSLSINAETVMCEGDILTLLGPSEILDKISEVG